MKLLAAVSILAVIAIVALRCRRRPTWLAPFDSDEWLTGCRDCYCEGLGR